MESLRQQLEQMTRERDHWKSRCETLMTELEQEKTEKYEVKQRLEESIEQVSCQAEYCSSMGAALSTLLWRASMHDDSVRNILTGSKVLEFIELAGGTLDTYMATYETAEDFPQDNAAPAQFVIALAGFITNVTASAYGREFLMRSVHDDVDCSLLATSINALTKIPHTTCQTLQKLLLMIVYNISINRKGFLFLCRQPHIIQLLASFLSDRKQNEVCIYALLSLQSLLHGHDKHPAVKEQLRPMLTDPMLHALLVCKSVEVRQAADTLVHDLKIVFSAE